ncbi:hypothetical protein PR003_g10358 [Phytophthora rubi]|uniref:HTH psq-type domain-containing protein n=1 Tax=Phytophthora rubi TaxID=129364 RepID=A0A6A3MWU7_9STRA|nr:hypothetical protein PR002_g10833 [Phytophthora rubi]KAE9033637.1 hypothetical protein PR001_g10072 [Phytophthora rubi]KAE9340697.1 hypothetical protein PR003_g10358 [Phytophthora rubi]
MRVQFTEEELREAVELVMNGEAVAAVVASSTVSLATLKRNVKLERAGEVREIKRPGPKPVLSVDVEKDLVEWILAMQRATTPVVPRGY